MSRPEPDRRDARARALDPVRGAGAPSGVVGARLSEMVVNRAEREVIVCCGAYNTPQLLMLSGIGRPDELGELQIEPVAESPEMGLNLHDHPNIGRGLGHRRGDLAVRRAERGEPRAVRGARAAGRSPRTWPRRAASSAPATTSRRRTSSSTSRPRASSPRGSCRATGTASRSAPACWRRRAAASWCSARPTPRPSRSSSTTTSSIRTTWRRRWRACAPRSRSASRAGSASSRPGCLIGPDSRSDEDIEAHCRQRLQTLYHPVGTCRMGDEPDLRGGPRAQGARRRRACGSWTRR